MDLRDESLSAKIGTVGMAEGQRNTPGVIRNTRDYIRALAEPAPAALMPPPTSTYVPKNDSSKTPRDNPRELRNKAEKQRRDKLNQSIAELASMVPPVVAASRKIDKTGVLRLTAHYLRAHQYVFGDSINQPSDFNSSSALTLLGLLKGFLLTTTYKGLIVVVSQNVHDFLGYTELDLLGQSIINMTHEDDRQFLKDQLMPRTQKFGKNGELLIPDDEDGKERVARELANEKRRFAIRLKKLGHRSEPSKYVTCNVEGSLRKSDRACNGYNRCCQIVRRARARGENPCSSGNDVVFIGVVRPRVETFIKERAMEAFKMEYRTRHSIDGEIIQCEHRIALITGYMLDEVRGVNAMNFIHRDEVHWVILSLRDMYNNNLLFGESCYRLMTKAGQFVYMSTRGRLDVDPVTQTVTSFICTNTVVEEAEGKHLIKLMKEKYSTGNSGKLPIEDIKDVSPDELPLEDPRQLEKVILDLVTNLPSPSDDLPSHIPFMPRYKIIPPKKERVISAIEKIYTVIKALPKPPTTFPMITKITDAPDESKQAETYAPLPVDNAYLATNGTFTFNPCTSTHLMMTKVTYAPDKYKQAGTYAPLPFDDAYIPLNGTFTVNPGTSTNLKMTKVTGAPDEYKQAGTNAPLPFDDAYVAPNGTFTVDPGTSTHLMMTKVTGAPDEYKQAGTNAPLPFDDAYFAPNGTFTVDPGTSTHLMMTKATGAPDKYKQSGTNAPLPFDDAYFAPNGTFTVDPNTSTHLMMTKVTGAPDEYKQAETNAPLPFDDAYFEPNGTFTANPGTSTHLMMTKVTGAPDEYKQAGTNAPLPFDDAYFAPNGTFTVNPGTSKHAMMTKGTYAPLPYDDAYLATNGTVNPGTSNFGFPYSPDKMAYYGMVSSEQTKFEMFLPHEEFQEQILSMPGTSTAGMKRTIHFEHEDQEISNKKKVIVNELDATEQITERISPSLEMFFDEAILNSQIESAIDSLDTIDPNFPDLLISNEVEELLGKIEERDEDIDI